MPFTASQIAEQVRGEVQCDGSVEISGLAAADSARAGDLTFAEKETYFRKLGSVVHELFEFLPALPPD